MSRIGPEVVEDGLIFYVDAFPPSYDGTWIDYIDGLEGTLMNGATYSGAGWINFNAGTNLKK